jgi:hypothetical protein
MLIARVFIACSCDADHVCLHLAHDERCTWQCTAVAAVAHLAAGPSSAGACCPGISSWLAQHIPLCKQAQVPLRSVVARVHVSQAWVRLHGYAYQDKRTQAGHTWPHPCIFYAPRPCSPLGMHPLPCCLGIPAGRCQQWYTFSNKS